MIIAPLLDAPPWRWLLFYRASYSFSHVRDALESRALRAISRTGVLDDADRKSLEGAWGVALRDPTAKLNNFLVDAFFSLWFPSTNNSTQLLSSTAPAWPCNALFTYLVPVFLATAAAAGIDSVEKAKEFHWSFNSTASLFGVSVQEPLARSRSKYSNALGADVVASERTCRSFAAASRGHRLIPIPVIYQEHFWLYIIDTVARRVERYDSALTREEGTLPPHAVSEARTRVAGTASFSRASKMASRKICGRNSDDDDDEAPALDPADAPDFAILFFAENYLGLRCDFISPNFNSGPVQTNGVDCGVFCCAYAVVRCTENALFEPAEAISSLQQHHIAAFRAFLVSLFQAHFEIKI